MGKHTAHGYLVEDVYKEAEKFTKVFGFKPARIDETFAGFPMEGKVEFFCGSGNIWRIILGRM